MKPETLTQTPFSPNPFLIIIINLKLYGEYESSNRFLNLMEKVISIKQLQHLSIVSILLLLLLINYDVFQIKGEKHNNSTTQFTVSISSKLTTVRENIILYKQTFMNRFVLFVIPPRWQYKFSFILLFLMIYVFTYVFHIFPPINFKMHHFVQQYEVQNYNLVLSERYSHHSLNNTKNI